MDVFDTMNPFSYLSWRENDSDCKVIDFVESNKYRSINKHDIDRFLDDNNLSYWELSSFAKDKLDELDI